MFYIFNFNDNSIINSYVFERDDATNEFIYYDMLACLSTEEVKFIINQPNLAYIDKDTYVSFLRIVSNIDMVKRDDVENMSEQQIQKLRFSIILAYRHYENYLKECAARERWEKEQAEKQKRRKEKLEAKQRWLEEQKRIQEELKIKRQQFEERKQEEERRYKEKRKHDAMVRKLFTSYSLDIPYMTMNQIQEAYQDATADYSNIYDT